MPAVAPSGQMSAQAPSRPVEPQRREEMKPVPKVAKPEQKREKKPEKSGDQVPWYKREIKLGRKK